jgi:putative spermidine/putrescine transport system permease protein
MKLLFRPLFLGLFVFWIFFPFLSIIIWSVAAGWRFPQILPEEYSMRGYQVSFDPDGDIVRGSITSTVIAIIVGVIATAIGSAAGRAIALYSFKFKKAFQFLVLAPLIVPGLAVTMGIQILFIKYGLADTMKGVILAHLIPTIPYVVMIMSG